MPEVTLKRTKPREESVVEKVFVKFSHDDIARQEIYNDTLVMTKAEYDALTPAELEAMMKARFDEAQVRKAAEELKAQDPNQTEAEYWNLTVTQLAAEKAELDAAYNLALSEQAKLSG